MGRELAERVGRLERANRRLCLALGGVGLGMGLLGVLGASRSDREVRAGRFVVVDAQGRERASWGFSAKGEGPSLDWKHPGGEDAGGIGVSAGGRPFLLLQDPRGKARISALIDRKGRGSIEVVDPHDNPIARMPVD